MVSFNPGIVILMGLFRRKAQYDRTNFLRQARAELGNGKHERAIALLRQLVAREPNNPELRALIAPPLAERGYTLEAWRSYELAAAALRKLGKKNAIQHLYADATRRLPLCLDAWIARAEFERESSRHDAALKVLLEARQSFEKRRHRPEAIALLTRALEINPRSQEITFDLAHLLSRSGRREEALYRLDELVRHNVGSQMKAVNRIRWGLAPSLANTWRLLRAAST